MNQPELTNVIWSYGKANINSNVSKSVLNDLCEHILKESKNNISIIQNLNHLSLPKYQNLKTGLGNTLKQ